MDFTDYMEPIVQGNYEIRLVKNEKEFNEYSQLRLKYLFQEYDPDRTDERDIYDDGNAHLCAFYTEPETGKSKIVGGYLLVRMKSKEHPLKTSQGYDLAKFVSKYWQETMELNGLFVHPDHRNGGVIGMLFDGIIQYIKVYNIRYLIGMPSFHGIHPEEYKHAISYLYHYYLMPAEDMVCANEKSAGRMDFLAKSEIDKKLAIKQMPPVIKGYLLLGAEVGNGMFLDKDYGSSDVFVIMDMTKFCRSRFR